MSQVSSQASREVLFIDCPRCGDGHQLLLLTSRTKKNSGKRFVKCPKNQPWEEEGNKCAFFMWLSEYEEEYVHELGTIQRVMSCNLEEKDKENGLNQTIVQNLDDLKLQMMELNERIGKMGRLQEFQMLVNGMCVLFLIVSFVVMLAK